MKIEFRGYDLEVEVTFYTPGNPGVTSGPPENCFPPEDEDVDWQLVDDDTLIASLIYESESLCDEVTIAVLEAIYKEQEAVLEDYGDSLYAHIKDEGYD